MTLASRIKRDLPRVTWLICFCVAFLSSYGLSGRYSPTVDLDSSWSAVLEYVIDHHFQFGKEIVFTYGPLGFLNSLVGQGHFIEWRLGFAIFWSVIAAWAAIGLARQIPVGPVRLVFLGWFLILSHLSVSPFEHHAYLVMAFGGAILLGELDGRSKGAAAVFLVAYALLALVKFTFFLAAIATVLLCAVAQLGERNAKASGLIVTLFGAIFVVLWKVAGQDLENLWQWIRGSLEITNGYTEAMTIVPKGDVLVASITSGVMFLATLWVILRSRPRSTKAIGLLAITALYVFLSWKHGFVRADIHVLYFILPLPLLFGVLFTRPVQDPLPSRTRVALSFVYISVVLLCFLAATFQEPGIMLRKLRDWPQHMLTNASLVLNSMTGDRLNLFPALEANQRNQRKPDLPVARDLIGNEPVDVVNYGQWAALVNGLVYRPRPVIQGYTAYTPYLQELNCAFFNTDRRPPYLLLHMETIDGRFPTLDDATALPFILNNYFPVARDGKFLVLKASGGTPGDVNLRLVQERMLAFGDSLDLKPWNDSPLFMRVTMRPTLLGRAIKFLFQAPVLFLDTQDSEGNSTRYRFIPSMAEQGFLVSPLLETNDDVVDLLTRGRCRRLEGIHFSRSANTKGQLADVINVRLYKAEHFPPDLLDYLKLRDVANLRNPVFEPYPSSIESVFPPGRVELDGEPALMVHAPSTVVLQIPSGAKQFYGSMGLLEGAYVGGNTDGVEFAIDVEDWAGKKRRLLTRLVQPREYGADRGRIPFTVPVDSQNDKRLILTADTGPKKDGSWDWSVWSGCRFK